MPLEKEPRQTGSGKILTERYFVLFMAIWFLTYLVFPSWLLPLSPLVRFLIFISFLIYLCFNSLLLYRWTDDIGNKDKGLLGFGKERTTGEIKRSLPFIFLSIIYIILHIHLMPFPIITRSDASAHVIFPLGFMSKVSPLVERYLGLSIPGLVKIAAALTIIVLVAWRLISLRVSQRKGYSKNREKALKALSIISLALLVGSLEFYLMRNLNFAPSLVRYPPIGKILYILTYSFLGISAEALRLVQLIFSLLAGFMLMRLVSLFRDDDTAFLSASILLFLPSFFYYSSLTELASGAIFFTVISSFYFLRFLKEERFQDLLASFFWVSTGFLYKRPVVVMLPIFWVFLLPRVVKALKKGEFESIKLYLKTTWIALVPILPWLVIGKKFVSRNYSFGTANWLSIDIMTRHLRQMPSQITLPLFILFLMGIFYGLTKRRDILTRFSIVWFLVYYIFFSSDAASIWIPVQRFALYLYPALAVIVAQSVGGVATERIKRRIFPMAYAVLIGYLMLSSTVLSSPPVEKRYIAYKETASRFLPYDKAVYYIKENLSEESKILVTMGQNPLRFYVYKYYGYDPKFQKRWVEDEWAAVEVQSLDNLYQFVLRNGIEYILFPEGGYWLIGYINEEMVKNLVSGRDKRFKMVETFMSGKERMHLWRVVNNGPGEGGEI